MTLASKYQGIVITSKEEYSLMQKLLCCKCFSCCQEEKVMTSDIRKQTIKRMVEAYLVKDNDQLLVDPVKLMILIYVCNDDSKPMQHIERCKINPSGVINYRTDLQFYIPQLCNYIVFHRSLQNNYLREAIEKMCKLNFYFAHLYYFYMKSLQKYITKTQIQILKPVVNYNKNFITSLADHYKNISLLCTDLYIDNIGQKVPYDRDTFTQNVIIDYQTKKTEYGKLTKVKTQDIILESYKSIFDGNPVINSTFQSTITFFDNLFYVCDDLKNYQNKKQKAIEYVKMINQHLPSTAYIPFIKNSYRLCNILKIVTSEVKVFSTKDRAPLCLCIETYSPAQALTKEDQDKFWTNVETPITLKMMTFSNRASYFARNYERTAQFKNSRQSSSKLKGLGEVTNIMEQQRVRQARFNHYNKSSHGTIKELKETLLPRQMYSASIETQKLSTKDRKNEPSEYAEVKLQKISQSQQMSDRTKTKSFRQLKNYNLNTKKYYDEAFQKMFGEPFLQSKERIAKNSVFGNIGTWEIVYIIIKTHDDLKQQQFAMQLIHQFDYIFKLEQLSLMLTTYQVLSMGADRGIIEMVKDAVTFDSLHKTLKTGFPTKLTLRQFFEIYYADDLVSAKQNFLKSLAAYCLAKDRHNGNILLHRNGKIFHIDFGFFLSNMPGGGIQLERDCPFKLLTQYIEILDGIDSYYFKKFRQCFFLGFKAIRKHQNKVLMLVKLMYSSSGMAMPCFLKGQAAITAMETRINPPGVTNDSLLNEHCQQLINLSLDNWAAKWYDRFQYWAQGIFY